MAEIGFVSHFWVVGRAAVRHIGFVSYFLVLHKSVVAEIGFVSHIWGVAGRSWV